MLFNISKQAVNPGKFWCLWSAKSGFDVSCKTTLELGERGIRVNGVNADRIRSNILNENMIANRAEARGVTVEKYMKGNLLKKVEARHIAEAFLRLVLVSVRQVML